MVTWRHAVLFSCRTTAVSSLLEELASSDAPAALELQHAAIIDHDSLGDLDVTIAGDGELGALVGQHLGTAVMLGPLLLIAAVQSGFAHEVALTDDSPPELSVRRLTEAVPPRSTALLVVTGCGDSALVQDVLRSATRAEFVAFDVSSRLEPWLASKVEVDLRVETPTSVPDLDGATALVS